MITLLAEAINRLLIAVVRAVESLTSGLSYAPTTLGNWISEVVLGSPQSERPGRRPSKPSYDQRIDEITSELRQSGANAQQLLAELDTVMKARQQQLYDAQANLLRLQLEESEVEERVQALKAVRPESAEAIHALLNESLEDRDKRSGKRDWIIFSLGVAVSIIISLVFQVVAGDGS